MIDILLSCTVYVIIAFFILLWAYAAFPKFFGMRRFRSILESQAIPKWMARMLTWLLPISELGVMVLLIIPETRFLGLCFSFLLMFIFTLYVGGIIFQVYDIYPCPCGALFKNMPWRKHYKVNILITLIALAGVILMQLGY